MPQKHDRKREYMRGYMRKRRAGNTLSPAPARVVCSACKHLAATYHHCLMRKDIRIANPDRPIECGEYVPAGRRVSEGA
jgi:hypothetical protein